MFMMYGALNFICAAACDHISGEFCIINLGSRHLKEYNIMKMRHPFSGAKAAVFGLTVFAGCKTLINIFLLTQSHH